MNAALILFRRIVLAQQAARRTKFELASTELSVRDAFVRAIRLKTELPWNGLVIRAIDVVASVGKENRRLIVPCVTVRCTNVGDLNAHQKRWSSGLCYVWTIKGFVKTGLLTRILCRYL